MGRPIKTRKVNFIPSNKVFLPKEESPYRKPVKLKIEETEALRLVDLNKMNMTEAAEKMSISRQTLAILLSSAREKITDTIINGKELEIGGGNYTVEECKICNNYQINNCPEEAGSCRKRVGNYLY